MPPIEVAMTAHEAGTMLRHLTSCLGVEPQALLLPRQPGCGRVKLCKCCSLLGLVSILAVQLKLNISQHTEVFAAHAYPKDSYCSHLILSHRPATSYNAGFTA